jgi:hypothetical protein
MDVVVLKHVVILHNSMTLYFALDLVLCSLESRHTLSIVILDALSIGAPLPPEALLPYYYRATTCINAFKHTMGVTPVVISPLPPPLMLFTSYCPNALSSGATLPPEALLQSNDTSFGTINAVRQENIVAQSGYWASESSSGLVFYTCPVTEACIQGNGTKAQCREGYAGVLCTVCDNGYFEQVRHSCFCIA